MVVLIKRKNMKIEKKMDRKDIDSVVSHLQSVYGLALLFKRTSGCTEEYSLMSPNGQEIAVIFLYDDATGDWRFGGVSTNDFYEGLCKLFRSE